MLVLAVATILHYFGIFTFHTEHYWIAFAAEWMLSVYFRNTFRK